MRAKTLMRDATTHVCIYFTMKSFRYLLRGSLPRSFLRTLQIWFRWPAIEPTVETIISSLPEPAHEHCVRYCVVRESMGPSHRRPVEINLTPPPGNGKKKQNTFLFTKRRNTIVHQSRHRGRTMGLGNRFDGRNPVRITAIREIKIDFLFYPQHRLAMIII